MFLLDRLLIGAPIAGIKFVFNTIAKVADSEINDMGSIREQILALNQELDTGQIGEPEFKEREAILMERWRAAKKRQLGE